MPLNETFKDSTMAEVMYTVQKELRPCLDEWLWPAIKR